ncbi:lytic transglycosylase domain-containing protein [Acidimangrovimonas pyrenivorans]|uniref:Transglycosylase SLT domain-containing protein n=1 Tax=Acidimangrovimonas pyrenivorans TaxID=2030798 RepID=A0ABV7ALF9_9RHOB
MVFAVPALAQSDPEVAALSEALQLGDNQDWDGAEAAAGPSGPIGRDIIEWQRLRAGDGDPKDYFAFLARRPDWPGLPYLRRVGEKPVAEADTAAELRAYFAKHAPLTAQGSLALQSALLAGKEPAKALAEAKRAWLALSYSEDEQARQLLGYGKELAPLHRARLEHLLWNGQLAEARRMLPLVDAGHRHLAEARIKLQARERGVDAAVAAVPNSLKDDPGLALDRFEWRFDKGYYDSAADLMLARSSSAKSLGRPLAWARERAALARREMREGDPKKAYRMAAHHHLSGGGAYADLEFLAGYIALRKLHDPKTALAHFRALRAAVTTPISLGRAAYWEGRANEALHDEEAARAAYAYGAEFQTAFYGLLSAEKAGRTLDPALMGNERYPDWRTAGFLNSSVLQAGLLLAKAGDRRLATRFFLHLAEGLNDTELAQLSDLALAIKEPHIAVMVAKEAAGRGVILARAYFPITPLATANLPIPPALALAIARRESEFDEGVISPAGARGLMQVMPATAKLMSSKVGVDYDKARLTQDGLYNAKLGSAYLAKLIDEFGPAITLVAAGYNAGPGRPRSWIAQFGDPRNPDVDPVDWIETVPLTETRNYIMRVAESLIIYRAKLAGKPGPIRLYEALKGK